jgi:hypothetical protein
MFDEVCQASPWFVRHFTRNALIQGLQDRKCGDVTEAIMYDVCKKVTPPKYLDQTFTMLDENKTTTT